MKNKVLGLVLILLFSITSVCFAEDESSDQDYEDTKNNIDLYIDNQLSKINIDEIENPTKTNKEIIIGMITFTSPIIFSIVE